MGGGGERRETACSVAEGKKKTEEKQTVKNEKREMATKKRGRKGEEGGE